MALLRWVNQLDPNLPVIIITGHGDVTLAVDAMRSGAYDFMQKPFSTGDLVAYGADAAACVDLARASGTTASTACSGRKPRVSPHPTRASAPTPSRSRCPAFRRTM